MAAVDRAAMLKGREEAVDLLQNGAFKAAEPLCRTAVQQTFAQKNNESYLWQRRLAQSLMGQEKFTEATKLMQDALDGFRLRGQEDEDVLDTKYLQAEMLCRQRKSQMSEEVARQALAALERNTSTRRGVDHPVTLKCRGLLAKVLKVQGKRQEAIKLAEENMEIIKGVLTKAAGSATAGSRRLSHDERCEIQIATTYCETVLEIAPQEEPAASEPQTEKLKPNRTASIGSTCAPDSEPTSRFSSKQSCVAP